jgi:phosphoribosylglycinamide formyltransferase-1
MNDLRLAIFASGSGSNMQAIVDAAEAGVIRATVALVVSNRENAGVLDRARTHDIPYVVLDPKSFDAEETYTAELLRRLDDHSVNFIALAGYLRKIPSEVVAHFRGRMLNIHPALLPSFGGKGYYGLRVHEEVLAHGVQWTGVTVHLVDEEYDTGPIVLQEPVKVEPDDTPESLAARVLKTEHKIYPEAIGIFAEGKARIEGRRVFVDE